MSTERQRVSSGSPYEPVFGFCRAVRAGNVIAVAGTAPVVPEGEPTPSGAYAQTQRCLEIIVDALRQLGAGPEHVVRTRVFAVRREDFEEIARAHREVFGDVRPASTFVIATLADPGWHVEIEADAVVD